MTKKALLKLLADNRFSELSVHLETVLQREKRQDLVEELAQLNGLHAQYRTHELEGTHSASELNTEAARLRKSYRLFIEEVYAMPHHRAFSKRRSRWLWPLLILILCAALIAVGYMKWPNLDFVMEGQTRYLAFRIDKNWDLDQDIYLEEFLSFTVKSAQIEPLNIRVAEGEALEEVVLSGGRIKWEEMDLPAGAVMSFSVDNGQISSQFFVDSLVCVFALRGASVELPNQDQFFTAGNDTLLVLAEMVLSEGPQAAFIPSQDSMFAFRLLPVSGLNFQRNNLEDDRDVASEIVDGQITTQGIPYSLENKPYVQFIDPTLTTLSFYQHGDLFHVRVEGKARDLTIGARPDAQASVKSTVIEHLGKSAQANLIWNWVMGTIAFLSGILALKPLWKR